jgi:cytochrome c biogenesis protein CcmG/thiol:disulfide interchange protein DsbE
MSEINLVVSASYLILWALVVFQSLVLLGVVRVVFKTTATHDAPPAQKEHLKVGEPVPQFTGIDLLGNPLGSEALAGKYNALLFVKPRCPSCTTTLQELHALRHKATGNVTLVCTGSRHDCGQLVSRYDVALPTIVDEEGSITELFRVEGTPYAVMVDEDGRIDMTGRPVRPEDLEEVISPAMSVQQARA